MAKHKTKKELSETLQSLDDKAQKQKQVDELRYPPIEITEADTRKKIAQRFVLAYFAILLVLIVGIPIYNLVAFQIGGDHEILQIPLADILQTYAAVVGPALGFVIAYYFKSKNEN